MILYFYSACVYRRAPWMLSKRSLPKHSAKVLCPNHTNPEGIKNESVNSA